MSIHLPSLPALRAFAAVAREGSFARAAEKLHISTSAVSHQIRSLEEQLGTPLLTRARNGAGHSRTAPTAAGEELLQAVEEALGKLAVACDAIREKARQPRRRLVVSANGSFASLWLAARLASFARQHPSVDWLMRSEESLRPDLSAEGIDIAVLRLKPDAMLPQDRLLFSETLFPVCSPALAEGLTAEQLPRLTLLQEEGNSPEREWARWLPLLGHAPDACHILRFDRFNQAISAAIAGVGIAIGRSPTIDGELQAGRLVRLFAPLSMRYDWAFVLRVRPGVARDPHVTQLVSYLLAEAGSNGRRPAEEESGVDAVQHEPLRTRQRRGRP
ncbi:LysR family transcriptional regulator [Acetobacteraceae bacterium H6797]|nr:LysR family transcriptional regulator [Acetobacteraceae bacterium H6797]